MLKVDRIMYRDLTREEQQEVPNNGCGKEYANYVRVTHGIGNTILLISDATEPEDSTLERDFKPLVDMVEQAYILGVRDGKKLVKNRAE